MASLLSFVDSGSKTHVGKGAVQRAQQSGMSIAEIKAAARDEGLTFASGAQSYINSASPFVSEYVRSAPTNNVVGLSAVQQAQSAGMSIADIKAAQQRQGFTFGSGAQNYINSASPFVSKYVTAPSNNLVGLDAVKRAQTAGMTIADIQAAGQSEGFTFGGGAEQYMQAASPFVRDYVTAPTNTTVGRSAVQKAQASGVPLDTIIESAGKQGFTFGEGAEQYLNAVAPMNQMVRRFEQQQTEQKEAAERQRRQLQIAQAYGQSDPADVRFSRSRAERAGRVSGGTTGAFNRQGLRISNLNLSNYGNTAKSGGSGSFA